MFVATDYEGGPEEKSQAELHTKFCLRKGRVGPVYRDKTNGRKRFFLSLPFLSLQLNMLRYSVPRPITTPKYSVGLMNNNR